MKKLLVFIFILSSLIFMSNQGMAQEWENYTSGGGVDVSVKMYGQGNFQLKFDNHNNRKVKVVYTVYLLDYYGNKVHSYGESTRYLSSNSNFVTSIFNPKRVSSVATKFDVYMSVY